MAAKKKIAQTVITEGKYYTINAANGKVVEVADYNIENGAKIQLWDDANAEWQQWGFVAAGDGVYRVQNRFTGKMMDLDMGGVSAYTSGRGPPLPASCGWSSLPTMAALRSRATWQASCWMPA